ncbi:MAG: hypothetical protein AAB519_01495 [Patescibacteria group bacterium]
MLKKLNNILQRISWPQVFILGMLLFFEISIHPLGFGPDRRIHDPAVYRLADPVYMSGDWYTKMATESGVYTFYADLVNLGPTLGIPEEGWRLGWYIVSLVATYVALLALARLFFKSPLVVPLIAGLHAALIISAPPIWLYGPFLQIDGGLAPRSIGMALSFVALYFLIKNRRFLPWILLGVATLVHVSNSLIVFSLFFVAWLLYEGFVRFRMKEPHWNKFIQQGLITVGVYIVSGGWFALFIATLGAGQETTFSDVKFIWTWIYLRAPYMALPLMPWRSWVLFALHCIALVSCWYLLWKSRRIEHEERLHLIGLIGVGGIVYFFAFYFFAFIWPWLPAFQFYSIRVIYLTYCIAYLFIALSVVVVYQRLLEKSGRFRYGKLAQHALTTVLFFFFFFGVLLFTRPGEVFRERAPKNLMATWEYSHEMRMPDSSSPTVQYLSAHPEPFLAPIHWFGSPKYLPHVASFKTFGFTKPGLEEWFRRMNDLSRGELQSEYKKQLQEGKFHPVVIDWTAYYMSLTPAEVEKLGEEYDFELFLTYQSLVYPFEVVAEDGDYRLYRIHTKE